MAKFSYMMTVTNPQTAAAWIQRQAVEYTADYQRNLDINGGFADPEILANLTRALEGPSQDKVDFKSTKPGVY